MQQIKKIESPEYNFGNEGSLLRLFQSEYFTTEMLIEYFHRYFNQEGIHKYLINKLYQTQDQDLEFYITQLSYLCVKKQSDLLKKFLIDKCAQSRTLYLLIYWQIEAYGESCKKKDEQQFKKLDTLERTAEMAHVNGEIHILQQSLEQNSNIDQSSEEFQNKMLQLYLDKAHRATYNDAINKFINNLIKISLVLKQIPFEDRKNKLKLYMKKANKWIQFLRNSNPNIPYFYGLIFPFQSKFNVKPQSNYIVRILEDEVACFNTKQRVPYKIVVETINIKDLDEFEPKKQAKNNKQQQNVESEFDIEENVEEQIFNTNDKYQGFVSWAQQIKKQEKKEKKQQKTLIDEAIDNTNYQTKMSEYHKIFQEQYYDLGKNNNKQQLKIVLNVNIQNPQRLKEYKENLERFKIRFPQKEEIQIIRQRRNSTGGRIQTPKQPQQPVFQLIQQSSIQSQLSVSNIKNAQGNFKSHKRRYSSRDFRIKEVLNFFSTLKQEYPTKINTINQICNTLHYDIIEKKLKKHIIEDQDIQNLVIPKKFGPFGELWEDKKSVIQSQSMFGHFPSYQLKCMIVKGNDDLRQEWLIMQIISKIDTIFRNANLPLQLKPYEIIVTSHNSGIIELCTDTLSIDALKKKLNGDGLYEFFTETFKYNFEEAQKNFIESLAAYSIVCFLLQIKDRHNGNILIDADGHLIHIDFGFVFTTSPGGNMNFESAPFKLTIEYVDVMGGYDSDMFRYFKNCMVRGFMELKKHVDSLLYLIQIMSEQSDLQCFQDFNILNVRQRFFESSTDAEYMEYVDKLVDQSYDNWRTNQYDKFQKITNGILP